MVALSLLVVVTSAGAVGVHLDSSDGENGVTELTVHTYDDPPAEQRRPGATERSYWTESVTFAIPDDEPVYLLETVTYRPVPSDCAASDTETFGIDRNNTDEGERRIDDSATESVKSFAKETDARGEYESRYGEFGALATTDWAYVERLEVQWYERDDFGAPLKIYRGDRFVSAQRDCLTNPDDAGWYRVASVNEGELENGTRVGQDAPTFSHWFYICDCASRREAVETLGPPPSEQSEATPTPTAAGTPAGTPTATTGADDGEADESVQETGGEPEAAEPGSDDTSVPDESVTETPGDGATPTPGAADGPSSPTPDWDDRVLETPTAAEGDGSGPVVALVALLAVGMAVRRR